MLLESLRKIYLLEETPPVKVNAEYQFEIHTLRAERYDYQVLLTNGLGRNKQEVPEKSKPFEHIELYMCLPEYWDLHKKPWPLQWLERIATVPQKNKTWFGPGDTLPAGSPPVKLDDQFEAEYFILAEPVLLKADLEKLDPQPAEKLLAVIPIFKREFDFKVQNSARELFDKFEKNGVTELIDIYRKPAARKRFMGVF